MPNKSYTREDQSPEAVKRKESRNHYLTYPLDLVSTTEEKYYISFRSFEPTYINVSKFSTGLTAASSKSVALNSAYTVTGQYKTTFDTTDPRPIKSNICLAIPGDSMVTSYGQEYSESEIDNIVAKIALSTVRGIQSGESFTSSASQAISGEMAQSLIKTVNSIAGGMDTGSLFNVASNPHVQVIYNRPALRTHTFNFIFYPTSPKESDCVNDIIRTFKLESSPDIANENGSVLERPYAYDICCESTNIDPTSVKSSRDKYMFRITDAVLTNVTVDHLAQKLPSFFEGMAPTAISLALAFKDTRIITRTDIENYNL